MQLLPIYSEWNERIREYCVNNAVQDGSRFTLAIHQILDETEDPHAAQNELTRAVREQYAECKKAHTRDALRHLHLRQGQQSTPTCIAFLAVSIIAAEAMEGHAYYSKLFELLGEQNEFPRALKPQSFEKCWLVLQEWLSDLGLSIDSPRANELRYISWPRKHVLLRRIDIKKLPIFFREYGFLPRAPVDHSFVEHLFDKWQSTSSCPLTRSGKQSWAKSTSRQAIIRQIVRTLSEWDSTEPQRSQHTINAATVRGHRVTSAWLELHREELVLCAGTKSEELPMCFGKVFERRDGYGFLRVSDLIPSDRELLLSSGWTDATNEMVSFAATTIYPFTVSEAAPWAESKCETTLIMNVRSAVLCKASNRDSVRTYIDKISNDLPKEHNIFDGWVLFSNFTPTSTATPPFGLEKLAVSRLCRHRFVGGLKCGHDTWLAGMGPSRLEVSNPNFSHLELNGQAVQLRDGFVDLRAAFSELGVGQLDTCVFTIGDNVEVIHFTEATIQNLNPTPIFYNSLYKDDHQASRYLLPPGRWILICESPEEILCVSTPFAENLTGRWQWAIGHDEHKQPAVVSLNPQLELPNTTRGFPSGKALRWSSAVTSASKPRFGALSPNFDRNEIRKVWLQYVSVARSIRDTQLMSTKILQVHG